MTEAITYRQALHDALDEAMHSDQSVFLMGEDVGRYGGSYAVSKGLLAKYGPERIRDTPISESGFMGAGIGAALAGMRPIVEIMTVNFSLLALDQIINNAATLLHMSGGQFNVPVVVRMATGSGNQLAAQHSHSWEGWYAHIPGIKIIVPATVEDARYMLKAALEDPDPVLIFEHSGLYNKKATLPKDGGSFDMLGAKTRRSGKDLTIVTYGASLYKCLKAADELASASDAEAIEAEVIDLRSLRPLDDQAIFDSLEKTSRIMIVDEGWKSGGISAEIAARIAEARLYDLDAPIERVCGKEVPIPYPKHLEDASVPQKEDIIQAARRLMSRG